MSSRHLEHSQEFVDLIKDALAIFHHMLGFGHGMNHRRVVTIAEQSTDGRIRQVSQLANDVHRSLPSCDQWALSTMATDGLVGDPEVIADFAQQLVSRTLLAHPAGNQIHQ